jgi:acylphosphatase
MAKQVRAKISGRVQGVWFRAWTVREATALGLNGWVRNCRDGTVEAVFRGSAEGVAVMLELCGEGPPDARVLRVDTVVDETPLAAGFLQLPTT